MIPRKIHFIFGLDPNFAGIPFSYYHYLAVKSAKAINPTYAIILHYHYAPEQNEFWERTKELATHRQIEKVPEAAGGKKIIHNAHKADILRMKILYETGGIYLDMDTICISPFDNLLGHHCVMGIELEAGKVNGLCNAVIMAMPKVGFLSMWREKVKEFDPHDWGKLGVRDPWAISRDFPYLIHIEPPESFFRTTWYSRDLADVHERVIHFERSYSLHLWESKTHDTILKNITEESVLTKDTSYNLLARKALGI
jgi:hypothetical protein